MSTDDSSTTTGAFGSEPGVVPTPATDAAGATPVTDAPMDEQDPGFFARHSALITAAMAAVIIAAVAIVGVWLYRDHVNDANAATEAAFSKSVEGQGATVDTVECDGGSCAAIIGGQAYSVLVQEDEHGDQHFGVSAYAGN